MAVGAQSEPCCNVHDELHCDWVTRSNGRVRAVIAGGVESTKRLPQVNSALHQTSTQLLPTIDRKWVIVSHCILHARVLT